MMGGLENTVGDMADAALAPVRHVACEAGELAETVRGKITDVWRGFFGSSTSPGETIWYAYSHQQLYDMVHFKTDPSGVGDQSYRLRAVAEEADDCAGQIGRQLDQTSEFWQGVAAERARSAMSSARHNGLVVADYTREVSASIYSAADALSVARQAMPEPVPVATVIAAGAVTGAAAGSFFGPPGTFSGAATGAGMSLYRAIQAEAERKAEAVRVMQSFESALYACAPPPAPEGPPSPGQPPPPPPLEDEPRHTVASGSPTLPATAPGALPGPAGSSPPVGVMGAQPHTDSAAPVDRHPAAGTRASAAATGTLAGRHPATGTAAAQPGVIKTPVGSDGRAIGNPAPWRDLVGRGGLHGVPGLFGGEGAVGAGPGSGRRPGPDRGGANTHRSAGRTVASSYGRGGGQTGLYPSPSGSRARGEENGDGEHRNKMPWQDQNLFTVDEVVPPPVIGA